MEPITIISVAVYSLLEYWLGKTTLVKPGSAIEAILLVPTLFKKEKPSDGKTPD